MKKILTATAIAACMAFSSASASVVTTFTFEQPGADIPTGNFTTGGTCGGINITFSDLCAIDNSQGLSYLVDGMMVTATAASGIGEAFLMQDLNPTTSGLAVLTPGENSSDDQVQLENEESIIFEFVHDVFFTGIDFNAGGDTNCATPGPEGPCGNFDLYVDGFLVLATQALDDMSFVLAPYLGSVFEFRATGPLGTGFSIGSITIATPLPAALPFFLTGIAAYGASRRRKKTA